MCVQVSPSKDLANSEMLEPPARSSLGVKTDVVSILSLRHGSMLPELAGMAGQVRL